ncbi:phosphoribosyltransferase family protein [Oerskovia sp. M15]
MGAPLATRLGVGSSRCARRQAAATHRDRDVRPRVRDRLDRAAHGDPPAGARVLVVDDVLATGGTASAGAELVERCGGVVVGLAFLLELDGLGGRARLAGRKVDTLLRVGS